MNGIDNLVNRLSDMAGQAAGTMKEIGRMGTQIEQLRQMVSVIRGGGNPMQLISTFAQSNPQAMQMLQNLQGKSPAELQAYAENMAKSYGTNVNDVIQSLTKK